MNDVGEGIWFKYRHVINGGVSQICRFYDSDLGPLEIIKARAKAVAFVSNNARVPDKVINSLCCSHIVPVAFHSAKEEHLGTFCKGLSYSITNMRDNRHGFPRLIPEHNRMSRLAYPGFPCMH